MGGIKKLIKRVDRLWMVLKVVDFWKTLGNDYFQLGSDRSKYMALIPGDRLISLICNRLINGAKQKQNVLKGC